MIELGLFVLATFGFVYVAGHSTISLPGRNYAAQHLGAPGKAAVLLMECPMCTSFHVGWISVAAGLQPALIERSWTGAAIFAFALTGAIFLLATFTRLTDGEQHG